MGKKHIVLVTGGQRSGKSGYAQKLALSLTANPVYLATSRVWDEEFRERVLRHQANRGPEWTNIEEEKYLSRHDLNGRVVVIDCVTLWGTNFFFDNEGDTNRSLVELKEEFNKFMGRYEKWNEAIAKDYLHQEEPLFDMKRKEGERWTPENRFMYEDIVRFFGGVVIRQQRYIEALQKDINTLKESRLEAAKGLEDANVDEETKKILQSLSEQIINQQKDIQRALENSEKIDAVRDKNQEVKVRSLTVGNELIDLRQDYDALQKETKKDSKAIRQESKERDKELKAMIRELEQTSLWFRLRRKWRHLTGKDAQ